MKSGRAGGPQPGVFPDWPRRDNGAGAGPAFLSRSRAYGAPGGPVSPPRTQVLAPARVRRFLNRLRAEIRCRGGRKRQGAEEGRGGLTRLLKCGLDDLHRRGVVVFHGRKPVAALKMDIRRVSRPGRGPSFHGSPAVAALKGAAVPLPHEAPMPQPCPLPAAGLPNEPHGRTGVQTAPGGGSSTPLALFQSHVRHATLSARRMARRLPRCVRREEVEAAALVGLWRAALAYDPGRGVLFRTYLAWRVRGEVLDALRADVLAGRSRLHDPPRRQPLPHGLAAAPDRRPGLVDLRDRLAPLRRLLSWRGRVLLRLIYDEDMTLGQAAEVFGLNACYLRQTHARALAVMRDACRDGPV